LQCDDPICQKHSIDLLFRRVWHYFDQIVIGDNLTHDVAHHWGPRSDTELRKRLLTRVDVLLHLRRIGAEELVQFREKGVDASDWRHALRHAGFTDIAKASGTVLRSLRKEAAVEIAVKGRTVSATVKDSGLSLDVTAYFDSREVSRLTIDQLKLKAIDGWWDEEMLYLAADVLRARELRTALGCVHAPHQRVLSHAEEITPSSVAFQLSFPILDGLPIATLLKMRRDESDLFSRFRTRLRAAIVEQSANRVNRNAAQIADEIRRDIIEPELRKIRHRLRASERLLAQKSAVGLALGSLVTTCGIFAGVPQGASLLGGVVAATAATQAAAAKHLEEQRDVSLEDLYFLWKATGHAPGQEK
jgi:hypothetical protein